MKSNQIRVPKKLIKPGIQTLDLEEFLPSEQEILIFDVKQYLFKELLLKESEFRQALESLDWQQYQAKPVRVFCSNNAIIPQWAWLLVSSCLSQVNAKPIYAADIKEFNALYILEYIQTTDWSVYQDKRIVIKGCGDKNLPLQAYVCLTEILTPIAKSIQYGEPCSTVPIFRKVNEAASTDDQES